MGFFDFLFNSSSSGSSRRSVRKETLEKLERDWDTIKIQLAQKTPSQLRQALITADKSLDNALRDVVVGESMGERLKNGAQLFDQFLYQKLWDAHKLRNNLVHESGFEPPYFVIVEGVTNLKEGLRALGVIIK